ncbi:MAG TPA: hypothetical protein VMU84_13130 [Thermoanaerobaculia bacterium]|nr:hypothetical protein [Thermoanaerobaculia bacterium]
MSSRGHDWQADFAVFKNGQLAAIAEAKKKSRSDLDWATAWFRNYVARQGSSAPPFILLATPDKVYLWKKPAGALSVEPTAVADASRLFAAYLRSNLKPTELSSPAFELVVGAWLNDLSLHLWQPSVPEDVRAFVESGLLEAIEHGRVVADIAA